MEILGSYCLTEDGSGSDARSMRTTAKQDGDDFIINGSKSFITGGSVSDLYLVFCLTGKNEHSAMLLEKGTEGLTFGKLENKMGWKNSPTSMVNFSNVRVNKR